MNNGISVRGACHCGCIEFIVYLPKGLQTARRCNCSYCTMRGAVVVTAGLGDISYIVGKELLNQYQFNTMTAEHYFCSRCGIYTHHRRSSNPAEISVNTACLDGISPFDFKSIPVEEGQSNLTQNTENSVAGILLYVSSDVK